MQPVVQNSPLKKAHHQLQLNHLFKMFPSPQLQLIHLFKMFPSPQLQLIQDVSFSSDGSGDSASKESSVIGTDAIMPTVSHEETTLEEVILEQRVSTRGYDR